MLNRRHIRVKVMNALFGITDGENANVKHAQAFLNKSYQNSYQLYLLILQLFIEVQEHTKNHLQKKQQKLLATKADKSPNLKFVNNQFINLLKQNESFKKAVVTYKVTNWKLDNEYVDIITKALLDSNIYKKYTATMATNFNEDKQFIASLFKELIAPNEKLYSYFEDKYITWLVDLPVINTFILKRINKASKTVSANYFTPNVFKNNEDEKFSKLLLEKTLLNKNTLLTEINNKTPNWDSDRIANVDYILLQLGLAEIKYFPSIPVKVTINEYVEIAKEYATPKSSVFINGILDTIVKEYQQQEKLYKIGRGLL